MTLYKPIRKSIYRLLGKPFYKRHAKQSVHVFQKYYRIKGKRYAITLERKRVAAYQDAMNRYNLLQQGIRARQRFEKQQARVKAEAAQKEKAAAKRMIEANQRVQRACKRQQQQQQQQPQQQQQQQRQRQQLEETVPEQHTDLTDLFTTFNLIH